MRGLIFFSFLTTGRSLSNPKSGASTCLWRRVYSVVKLNRSPGRERKKGKFLDFLTGVASLVAISIFVVEAQEATHIPSRTHSGHPNLNGIWQANNTAHWNVEAHSATAGLIRELGAIGATPGGPGVIDGGVIPYREEALQIRNDNFSNRLTLDPEVKCYLPGVPRATYMPYPFQIIQTQDYVIILYEYAGAIRTVYMKDHMNAPAKSWMGWSNGHWDGNTLIIESEGFNDKTWFDRAGNFHSDAMKVTERFTPRSADTLWYHVTIEDPKVFTHPWTMGMPIYRRVEANAELMEFKCVAFVEDLIYGHLEKGYESDRVKK
jgi:hypothetical protein